MAAKPMSPAAIWSMTDRSSRDNTYNFFVNIMLIFHKNTAATAVFFRLFTYGFFFKKVYYDKEPIIQPIRFLL